MGQTYITARELCKDARAMVGQFKYAQVDCIRVIVNPLKTRGKTFPYTGSNYFVRYEVVNLQRLKSESQLAPGKALLRSREPDEMGYALPERYMKGKACDTGDYRDYHHIGLYVGDGQIVDSNKTATQDGPAISTNWRAWEWVADIVAVEYPVSTSPDTGMEGGEEIMNTAMVETGGLGAVNIRQDADANAKLCFKNPKIPEGAAVEVLGTKGAWTQVRYGGETGWLMSKYLAFIVPGDTANESPSPVEDDGGDTITISRATAEAFYNTLGNLLGK